jgi:hypothetical protein
MATTIPACIALLTDSSLFGRAGFSWWDALPPAPTTSAQRATIITAILAGTVATKADVLALIATAATGGVSQQQVYSIMVNNPATVG